MFIYYVQNGTTAFTSGIQRICERDSRSISGALQLRPRIADLGS